MSTARRTLFSNGSWSLANQIVRVGTLALVTIVLSRHFGPQAFGALAVGLALVRIFAVIGTFGLDRVVVRRVAENEGEAEAILWTAFRLKLLIALASYGVLLALIACVDAKNTLLLGIALLAGGGLLFQSCDVFDYYFQAHNRFRLTFIGRTLPTLFATALKLGAIILGAPLLAFAALEGIEMALVGAVLFLVYRRCADPKAKVAPIKRVDSLPLLREGLPLLLGMLAAMIYMRSDMSCSWGSWPAIALPGSMPRRRRSRRGARFFRWPSCLRFSRSSCNGGASAKNPIAGSLKISSSAPFSPALL